MDYKVLMVLVVCLIIESDVARADGHESCFDSIDTCTQNLRDLLVNEDMFWFGSDYARNCVGQSMSCINPDTTHLSIMARLYNSSDKASLRNKADTISLADVQYPGKQGDYYACGHAFESYGKTLRMDPMKVTTVDSWTLDLEPTIEFDADPDTYYTIAVWDVGYFYLHGLYINARNGPLIYDSNAIDPYYGPVNPMTRPNVYLYGVFRQTGYIDIGKAYQVMGTLLGQNQGTLPMASFLADMTGMIAELKAANVMSVVGDAYSMERQKNRYVINNCPALITQSSDLKSILKMAGVEAIWTTPKKVLDYTEPSHLSTLTTELSVEYSMAKDLVVDSCCVQTTITQSMYRPDPLGTHVTKPALISSAPRINISPINIMTDLYASFRDQTYTLLMVDMTDASDLIIHWMVTDIKKADVSTGDTVLPYMGPNPYESDQPRVYVIFLLTQKDNPIAPYRMSAFTNRPCLDTLRDGCGADISRMMKELNMEDIAGITWFQAVQDAYARKQLYSDLKVKTMVGACDGQPGFEWPCPKDQYCARSTNSGTVLNGVSLIVLSSFVTVLTMLYRLVGTV